MAFRLNQLTPEASEALKEAGFEMDVAYMQVPRCDDCKWWRPFAPGLQPDGLVETMGLGGMMARAGVPIPQRMGDCRLFECHEKEQVYEESKLEVTRTQSGEATIVTQADFGCVQWEAKP